jgi:hypothetical protein
MIQQILAIVAIAAAVGLLGLVVVETVNIPQQEQALAKGCFGPGFNASQGRCFHR